MNVPVQILSHDPESPLTVTISCTLLENGNLLNSKILPSFEILK
jgi:hypothetical protein